MFVCYVLHSVYSMLYTPRTFLMRPEFSNNLVRPAFVHCAWCPQVDILSSWSCCAIHIFKWVTFILISTIWIWIRSFANIGFFFEFCVWGRAVSSHDPQEVLLAQFSMYVYQSGLKLDSLNLFRHKRSRPPARLIVIWFGIDGVVL